MEFFEEIKNKLKKDLNLDALGYKIYILDNVGTVVMGVRDIALFTDTKIIVNLKKNKIELNGVNLHIKAYSKNDILIGGKINKVEIL